MKRKGKTEARVEAEKLEGVRGQTGLGWCLGQRGFLGKGRTRQDFLSLGFLQSSPAWSQDHAWS